MKKNKTGKKITLSRTITEEDIEAFGKLSLDDNPIHFNDKFAAKMFFKKRIAHGMIGAALISGALTKLMGEGNIWLSSSIKFEKPIYISDSLTCTLTIDDLNQRGVAAVKVEIKNQKNERIISGSVQSIRFMR